MNYQLIIEKVSKDLDIPTHIVDNTYKSFWLFIRDTILLLDLKDDISLEEFKGLRTNFNIPSLGKLSCTYDRMLNMKKRYKYINGLRNK